jgi:hypothetical protein
MTEWYTHFDAKEFAEVRGVQEALLLPEQLAGDGKTGCEGNNSNNRFHFFSVL